MVDLHKDYVSNVASTDFPGNTPGVDDSWNLEKFQRDFDINISYLTNSSANLDLINIDTSLANAFRRIMIAEIPTVAIEKVFIEQNTSVIQDEVLASRLGLIPLLVSPDQLEWQGSNDNSVENTVAFQLNVKCTRDPETNEIRNSNVYAKDLVFQPFEVQNFPEGEEPRVGYPDILIAKLGPGQEIALSCWAVLGIGADHAKFSPVATASYRLMPQIEILGHIDNPKKFQECFTPGVIALRDSDGQPEVVDPRRDTVSREVLRHPEFDGKVKLGRKQGHFIFNIESVGAMTPAEIFLKSVAALKEKATVLKNSNIM